MLITEHQIMTTWNIHNIATNKHKHIVAYYTDDKITNETKQQYYDKYSNIDFYHTTTEYTPEKHTQCIVRFTNNKRI